MPTAKSSRIDIKKLIKKQWFYLWGSLKYFRSSVRRERGYPAISCGALTAQSQEFAIEFIDERYPTQHVHFGSL